MPSDDPYGRFLNEFLEPVRDASEAPIDTSSHQSLEIGQFMEQFAGASFREGLYRVHSATTLAQVVEGFTFGFPAYAEQVLLFGYDWLGRQFGLPTSDPSGSQPRVILFEPGVGKAFDIPANLQSFHNDVLVNQADAALATSLFADWKMAHPETIPIGLNDCAGYRVPLFLGGKDTVENLEIIDCSVYWYLTGQLIRRHLA